jgi:hypothetical protein
MTLQIRNERVNRMARELADRWRTTKTDAVMRSLEEMLKTEDRELTVQDHIKTIAEELHRRSTGKGRDLNKDEIDVLWGHDD